MRAMVLIVVCRIFESINYHRSLCCKIVSCRKDASLRLIIRVSLGVPRGHLKINCNAEHYYCDRKKMFLTETPSDNVKAKYWLYCDCVVFVWYYIQPENISQMWTRDNCRKGAEKLIPFTRYVRSINMKGPPIFYLVLQQARGIENLF